MPPETSFVDDLTRADEALKMTHGLVDAVKDLLDALKGVELSDAAKKLLVEVQAMLKGQPEPRYGYPEPRKGEHGNDDDDKDKYGYPEPKMQKSTFRSFIPVRKVSTTQAAQRIIDGVIYPADKVDAHGDFADPEDLRKAAHGWLAHSRETNVEHGGSPVQGVHVVESHLATADIPEVEAHKNDWVAAFKVENQEVWKGVESGEFRGFSIEGVCDKIQVGNVRKMVNLLVTRVSLVRDPATRMAFTAKSASNLEVKKMETLKSNLDKVQALAAEAAGVLGANLPTTMPRFEAAETLEKATLNALQDQSTYVQKVLENVIAEGKALRAGYEKAVQAAKDLKDAFQAEQEKANAYEKHLEIGDIAQLLQGAATS